MMLVEAIFLLAMLACQVSLEGAALIYA